ncbi:uncharacterized protein LOC135394616 [Ornithodoros turicata]|uniref:uncharacterized protein LOC135394616 n=1 Tax=Ornithodoros turicata TaxID=34597 RepID=UPI0031396737
MHHLMVFAMLFAGAAAAIIDAIDTPFKINIGKEIMALNMDPMPLPDIEFSFKPTDSITEIKLINGKVEGLSKVIKPLGRCMERKEDDDIACHITIDGLRIIYEATSINPDKTFDVEVIVQHSAIEMIIGATSDGMMILNDIRIQSLYPWIRTPKEFSGDMIMNSMFDRELKMKLHELIADETVTAKFNKALEKVIALERFPTKIIGNEIPIDTSFIIGI